MDLFSPQSLKAASGHALSRSVYPPKKLVLLHTGVTLLASLFLTVVNFFLSNEIATTGGLAGIGTRSVLTAIQTLLPMVVGVLLPFWELGFLYCVIRMARHTRCYPDELTMGFRRFSPLLRLLATELLMGVALAFVSVQVASVLFSFTPYAEPMMEDMQTLMQNPSFMQSGTIPTEMLDGMMTYMIPLYAVAATLFLGGGIFLSYRFRFSRYTILDQRCTGPVDALRTSWKLTKGHTGQLFSLDLSYWWYYLLQLVIAAVAYADLLLPVMGISISKEIAYFAAFFAYLVLSLVLALTCRAQVETTYACFYLRSLPPEAPEEPSV